MHPGGEEEGGQGDSGQGGDDVVGIGETSRREEKQVNQVRDKPKSEFFKPLAKRNKIDSEGDLKPGLQEMESGSSLKVPGQLENFLGVDLIEKLWGL